MDMESFSSYDDGRPRRLPHWPHAEALATTRLQQHPRRQLPEQPPQPLPQAKLQQQQGRRKHGVLWELMPLVWTLRFMLMLPVSINAHGGFRFRWVSLPMALTLAVWLLLVVVSYYLVRFHLDPVSDDRKHYHVWDLVLQYAAAIGVSYIAFMPFTSWATAAKAVAMMDQWRRAEAHMAVLRDGVVVLHLRSRAIAISVGCLAVPVVAELGSSVFSPTAWRLWMLPSLAHSFSYFMLATLFWHLCCHAIATAARQMAEVMVQDFQRLGVRGLRAHRRVWLDLCKVLSLLCETWGRTHTLVLALLFVSFSAISFLLMHILLTNDMFDSIAWFGLSYFVTVISIFSICNSAQHATDSLRVPATKQLLLISQTVKDDKTVTEILQFLREIQVECPRVSVCRLAVLSRSSILSMFALANTYIVVLSQFTIMESSTTNFTEDPGIAVPDL